MSNPFSDFNGAEKTSKYALKSFSDMADSSTKPNPSEMVSSNPYALKSFSDFDDPLKSVNKPRDLTKPANSWSDLNSVSSQQTLHSKLDQNMANLSGRSQLMQEQHFHQGHQRQTAQNGQLVQNAYIDMASQLPPPMPGHPSMQQHQLHMPQPMVEISNPAQVHLSNQAVLPTGNLPGMPSLANIFSAMAGGIQLPPPPAGFMPQFPMPALAPGFSNPTPVMQPVPQPVPQPIIIIDKEHVPFPENQPDSKPDSKQSKRSKRSSESSRRSESSKRGSVESDFTKQAKTVFEKLREAYKNDNKVAPSKCSMLLDAYVYYRGDKNVLVWKQTSSPLLMMASFRLNLLIKSHRYYYPDQRIIISLPLELSPVAVDDVMNCAHGGKLNVPSKNRTEYFEFVFIAAKYLKMYDIVNEVKDLAIKEKIRDLNFEEMKGFVDGLPEPKFMKSFPKEIDDLPSRSVRLRKNSSEKSKPEPEQKSMETRKLERDNKRAAERMNNSNNGENSKKWSKLNSGSNAQVHSSKINDFSSKTPVSFNSFSDFPKKSISSKQPANKPVHKPKHTPNSFSDFAKSTAKPLPSSNTFSVSMPPRASNPTNFSDFQ